MHCFFHSPINTQSITLSVVQSSQQLLFCSAQGYNFYSVPSSRPRKIKFIRFAVPCTCTLTLFLLGQMVDWFRVTAIVSLVRSSGLTWSWICIVRRHLKEVNEVVHRPKLQTIISIATAHPFAPRPLPLPQDMTAKLASSQPRTSVDFLVIPPKHIHAPPSNSTIFSSQQRKHSKL